MKKITFCFALLLMAVSNGFGQVQIGDGTIIDKGVPFEPSRSYSYTQSIYLASEILATGTITSIQYYYAGPYNLEGSQNLTVYVGHSTKTSFASTSDWEPINNLTEVYTGNVAVNGAGWISFELENPFLYNGIDNLIIAVRESSDEADYGEDDFYTYEVAENRSLTLSSYSDLPDPENPANGTLQKFVANITFEGINQVCPKPTELLAFDPTTTGVSLSWNSTIGDALGGSQYYISATNVAPEPTTEPTGSVESGGFALITTGLLPATKYYVWVRDVCESGPGTWSNRTSFITACEAITTFSEDFNAAEHHTLPVCWSSFVYNPAGAQSLASVTVTNEDGYTGNSIEFYRNGDATSDLILISPMVSNLAAGTHRLKFFAKNSSFASNTNFQIGTMSDTTPGSAFNEVDQVTVTNVFQEFTIDFTSVSTEDTYIAIKLNYYDENYLGYIDNIRWELTPSCPDVKAITVPVATIDTATIQWLPGEDETQWDVVHDLTATADPNSLPIDTATTLPTVQISDLSPDTEYFVWVRSICEAGNGLWMGPVSFRTPCNPVTSFIETFDAVASPELPNCWTKILRGETLSLNATIKTIGYNANSAPNTVEIYSGYSTPGDNDDIILVSPNLGNLSEGTHRLKFYAQGIGTLQIITLDSNTATANYTDYQTVTVLNGPMTEYVVDFSTYTGTDNFIGIRFLNALAFDTMLIDDVVWEQSPSCPDVSQISFPEIFTNSVTVNWVSAGATQWEVVHGPVSVIDPNTLTPSEILTSPDFEIEGLTDNTTYKVWIRSVCGEIDGNGAWSSPLMVTTACAVTNAFNETFEGTTIPELPSCWSAITSNSATVSTISWQPHDGSRSLEMYNMGAELTTDILLISPKLNNLDAGTHRVRFFSRYIGGGNLDVGTINEEGVFTSIMEVELTDTYQEYIVPFNSYEGDNIQIAFKMLPTDNYQTVNLDNIIWEVDPELSNDDFDHSNFMFYPNPVKDVLHLSYKQNITTVSVYNLLGQKVIENTADSNSTQVNMEALATGNYIVRIQSENQTKTIKVIKE